MDHAAADKPGRQLQLSRKQAAFGMVLGCTGMDVGVRRLRDPVDIDVDGAVGSKRKM